MYKVIKFFTDLQDKGHAYNVGDIFPREGVTVSKSRIKELSGANNRQKTPLIALDKDSEPEEIEEKPTPVESAEPEPVEPEVETKKRNPKKNKE